MHFFQTSSEIETDMANQTKLQTVDCQKDYGHQEGPLIFYTAIKVWVLKGNNYCHLHYVVLKSSETTTNNQTETINDQTVHFMHS